MMLSKQDLARVDRLELSQPNPDISWLCQTVRRLARIKPTEGEFPEFLHTVIAMSAFPVKYAETVHLENEFNSRNANFLYLLKCEKSDVYLFVRPYVRLETPKDAEILMEMEREGRYTVLADGDIISKGPLAEILVGLDGYGVRRQPISMRVPTGEYKNIFRCGTSEDPLGAVQVEGVDLGVFLTNETQVVVNLELPNLGDKARISIGLVAARYTTKGILTPVSRT